MGDIVVKSSEREVYIWSATSKTWCWLTKADWDEVVYKVKAFNRLVMGWQLGMLVVHLSCDAKIFTTQEHWDRFADEVREGKFDR